MYPLRLMIAAPPSDTLDGLERVEGVDTEELEGVDTERSRSGIASRGSEGEILGDGELERCSGEVGPLIGGVAVVSCISTTKSNGLHRVEQGWVRLSFKLPAGSTNRSTQATSKIACCPGSKSRHDVGYYM